MRYNIDLNVNPGLPTIISEYYGPHSFFDAQQVALARLERWREESLSQIQEECLPEKLDRRRRAIVADYSVYHRTVSGGCGQDVDRKEQDSIAGPLSALMQVLPSNRRRAVFAEIMEAVCRLDSADLQRLSKLTVKMSEADHDGVDDEI